MQIRRFEICVCDKKVISGIMGEINPISSSVRGVPTPPCTVGNYPVRSAEDNVDEAGSLILSICQGIDVMDKQTLNHCRIVIRKQVKQTVTPEPKWYETRLS